MEAPRRSSSNAARDKRARRRAFELQRKFGGRYPRTVHKLRPLRPERLHPYSRGFHEHLLRQRPEWLGRAFNVLGYAHDQFDLQVEVPHPRQGRPIGRLRLPAEPITLWMNQGEELSVGWGEWHTHTGMGAEPRAAEDDYREAVDMVDAITSEQVVQVLQYDAGRLFSAGTVQAPDLEDWVERLREFGDAGSLVIRSWNATHDRRLDLRA